MSDGSAFIQALAEAPFDDTVRLVYADWLDEHDESHKAAFLRAECVWATEPAPAQLLCKWGSELPPESERYPLVLRELSELVGCVPLEWFAAVSRVAWEVRALSERFASRVPVRERCAGAPCGGAGAWLGAIERVRCEFASRTGASVVNERFVVPVDFVAFAVTVGGIELPDESSFLPFDYLADPERVAERTSLFCGMFEQSPGADFGACGFWLSVGARNHELFHLCCDRASPLFGTLSVMEDSHPWIGIRSLTRPSSSEVATRSFLDFLRYQVVRAELDEPDE